MSNIGFGDYASHNINNFLKLAGASYSIYSTNKDRDVSIPSKVSDYWLSGFDGAFAGKCLEDYVPIIFEVVRPIKDYVIDSYIIQEVVRECGLLIGYVSGYYVDSVVSGKIQEVIVELLKVGAAVFGALGSTLDVALLLGGGALLFVYLSNKEELSQMIGDSERKKMAAALILSIFTARLAGCFNTTLVNLVYLTILARRKVVLVKKLTDFFVVEPVRKNIYKPFRKKCIAFAEKEKKEAIDAKGEDEKTVKHRVVRTFLGYRENSSLFRSLTDSVVERKVSKKLEKSIEQIASTDLEPTDNGKNDGVSGKGSKKGLPKIPNKKSKDKDEAGKTEEKKLDKRKHVEGDDEADRQKNINEKDEGKETEIRSEQSAESGKKGSSKKGGLSSWFKKSK